jgi:hypothetical protein
MSMSETTIATAAIATTVVRAPAGAGTRRHESTVEVSNWVALGF